MKRNAFPRSRPRGSSALEGLELDSRRSISRPEPPQEERKPEGTVGASFADDSVSLRRSGSRSKFENVSTNAAKVIDSYGLSESEARSLKEHHRQAEKMLSRDEKFDRYKELFRDNPYDYLAAYQAAKIMYDIGHYKEAKEWAEKSLSVNPRYSPAKKLSKAASSNM